MTTDEIDALLEVEKKARKLELGVGIHTYTHPDCSRKALDADREELLIAFGRLAHVRASVTREKAGS